MQHFIEQAADYYVVTLIAGCVVLGSLVKSLTTIVTTAARERSRREIAAYIAEGSMSPEQGERLMKADVNSLANRCV